MKFINNIFNKIYMIMCLNVWFIFSSIVGLFFFSLYPALISCYELVKKDRIEKNKFKIRIIRDYTNAFKKNIKLYYKESIIQSGIIMIILYNIFFHSLRAELISGIFYYLSIFSLLSSIIIINISAYIKENYEISIKENYRNAVMIYLAYLLDIVVAIAVIVAILIIFENISLMLLFLTSFGLIFYIIDFTVTKTLENSSISNLLFRRGSILRGFKN